MEMRRSLAVASAALLAQAACASTSYTPRAPGRIAMALEDGRQVMVKDGKTIPIGGDGLMQAVAGNPAAEEHARSYASDSRIALAENLIGLGALVAGAIVSAPARDAMDMELPVSTERKTVGAILGIAGLVALVVGGFQSASAQAHYMDAINVYNDGVQPRPPPGFQPQSPVPLPPPAPAPATPQPPPATPQPPPATPAPQAYPPPPATAPAPPSP